MNDAGFGAHFVPLVVELAPSHGAKVADCDANFAEAIVGVTEAKCGLARTEAMDRPWFRRKQIPQRKQARR